MEHQQALIQRSCARGGDAADFVSFWRRIVDFDGAFGGVAAHNNLGANRHCTKANRQYQNHISCQLHTFKKSRQR